MLLRVKDTGTAARNGSGFAARMPLLAKWQMAKQSVRFAIAATITVAMVAGVCAFSTLRAQELPVPRPKKLEIAPSKLPSELKFLYEFACAQEAKPKSETELVDVCLPASLASISFKEATENGRVVQGRQGMATAFCIGGKYFITVQHAVKELKDSTFTINEPLRFDGREDGIPIGEAVMHTVLVLNGKEHAYRVVLRDSALDFAVLEAKGVPAVGKPIICLDRAEIGQADTIVHYMDGIYGNKFRGISPSVIGKRTPVMCENGSGNRRQWLVFTPLESNVGGYYLKTEGFVLPFTAEGFGEWGLYQGGLERAESLFSSSAYSMNGNSGAPVFKKVGNGYVLAGLVSGGHTSMQMLDMLGMEWQQGTTDSPRPERISELVSRFIEKRMEKLRAEAQ